MKYLYTFSLIDAVAKTGSIRRAANDMHITASALTRHIQRFEIEFGCEIFERLPNGVRLNTAGEMVLHHYQKTRADLERVRSQIADLSGIRRGHVSITCSQALMPYFLPTQIAQYRANYPGVNFSVSIGDRAKAETKLADFSADLALVFEPVSLVDFDIVQSVPQQVCALMKEDHPLARAKQLRLRDILNYPLILPSEFLAIRHLLNEAIHRMHHHFSPILESDSFEFIRHYVLQESAIGFQIPIGIRTENNTQLTYLPISEKDIPIGSLFLGQMRGRSLPVASSRFAQQVSNALNNIKFS